MKALIDGDIILYRVGYTTENEEDWVAISRMEELVQRILTATHADDHCIYFSDSRESTFRAKMCPEYKATRTQPKPFHYQLLKDWLTKEYNTQHEVGQEADDGMGIEQAYRNGGCNDKDEEEDTVICSIDKDMLQIPGHHYNFVKDSFSYITEDEGRLHFYKQIIIGDVADNVKGVAGIGPAKAAKLLDPLLEAPETALLEAVQGAYRTWLTAEWGAVEWGDFQEKQMNNLILVTGRLLKIRQQEEEIWNFPKELNITPETTPQL